MGVHAWKYTMASACVYGHGNAMLTHGNQRLWPMLTSDVHYINWLQLLSALGGHILDCSADWKQHSLHLWRFVITTGISIIAITHTTTTTTSSQPPALTAPSPTPTPPSLPSTNPPTMTYIIIITTNDVYDTSTITITGSPCQISLNSKLDHFLVTWSTTTAP